jgi:hypothetical protein
MTIQIPRHSPEEPLPLEAAQQEFDEATKALAEANRAARAAGKVVSPDLLRAAERVELAHERLKAAQATADANILPQRTLRLPPVVLAKIRDSFPTSEQPDAIRILEVEFGGHPTLRRFDNRELERIMLAVIKLAGTSLTLLRRNVDVAKVDWRDSINAAEHPKASAIGLVEYAKLDEQSRNSIDQEDRQQYLAWLNPQ